MIIYKFEPLYQERPWGGDFITKKFGRKIKHKSSNIGESWEIVDRPEAQSIITFGPSKGMSLREIIFNDCDLIMGPVWNKKAKFPVLVKWLDCKDRLSLQVHPPKSIASHLGGESKTENWYVADSTKDSALFIGFKKNINRDMFETSLKEGNIENLCHRVSSHNGDSILVRSGRIHAIDAGNLILEIQQNSDTTYRVFDWGRIGLNGKPRKLHVEESLKSINFNDIEPELIKPNDKDYEITLAKCENFRIRKFNFKKNNKFILKKENEDCALLHLISGKINVGENNLNIGEQCLSPFNSMCEIKIMEHSTVLVTDQFVNHENLRLALSN